MLRSLSRLFAVLVVVCSLGVVPSVSAETNNSEISVTGKGWGHGVGLSQYGARAMADEGMSVDQILSYYFPGTETRSLDTLTIGNLFFEDKSPIWVGLAQNLKEVVFKVEKGTADLCFDETNLCVATAYEGESWKFFPNDMGLCNFARQAGQGGFILFEPAGSCSASITPISDGIFYIPRKGRSYRDTILRIRKSDLSSQLHLVGQLGIETYTRGVKELPENWPGETLRAQAIVTRTFITYRLLQLGAASEFDKWRMNLCACHVFDDDAQQFFGGYTSELGNIFWIGQVGISAGEVISFENKIANVRFTSSNGGRTEDNLSDQGVYHPYLISKDDRFSLSSQAANPYMSWTVKASRNQLGKIFGFTSLLSAKVVENNESGTVKKVELSGIILGKPEKLVISGKEIQKALNLYSPYYEINVGEVFDDMNVNTPFASEVIAIKDLGITSGCTVDKFCPDDPVTRGQMAAFLVRALSLDSQNQQDRFTDDDDSIFEPQIETLYDHGITSGCTVDKFCPDDPVTRGQMAAFLVRAINIL